MRSGKRDVHGKGRSKGSSESVNPTATVSTRSFRTPILVLGLLLVAFVLLQCPLPLRTAIKIGADEDFELAKATLWLKGYHFYTEVWNDQPLVHTFLITQVLKHISPSVLGPRLVTSAFTLLLLGSVFLISRRVHGLGVATLTTALVIASPGFLELSSSCMMEIPSLAPALAALGILAAGPKSRYHPTEVIAGGCFAAALQSKFIGVIYLPLILLVLWLRQRPGGVPLQPLASTFSMSETPRPGPLPIRWGEGDRKAGAMKPRGNWSEGVWLRIAPAGLARAAAVFAISLVAAFVAIHFWIGEGGFWLQLRQSWASHFAGVRSFEYGSPQDRPFDWSILLKNWDSTVPALVGIVWLLRQTRQAPWALLPLAWTALTLVVFGRHTPWWSYYYVHNAIPLCWCAAVGWVSVGRQLSRRGAWGGMALLGVCAVGATAWMGARLCLQVQGMRHSPRIHSALVLREIERYRPFTQFLYTEEPVYSFHAGIPMPPRLAVVALKRFWSGDLTNTRLVEELQRVRPGMLLLTNDTRERPFQDWMQAEYRLVYEDTRHRLYALRSVIDQAER